jgi:imidazole glycerol-phosphate synthase subunit HisF
VLRPEILTETAARFGSQCVVVSIDAARDGSGWRVHTHGGKVPTEWEAVAWARECVRGGAGEILLTSIDADGQREGYDLELTRAVVDAVRIPVIASGGAGTAAHLVAAAQEAGAEAVLLAGILHDGSARIGDLKRALAAAGVPVRRTA